MLYISPFITAYSVFMALIFGACMGSFLGCMGWRIVHGESVIKGRSHCDSCGHVLGVRDLVPVASFLLAKGRCRYCGKKLSPKLLWEEIITAAVFVLVLLKYDISLKTLEYWVFSAILLGAAFADLEGYIIPNRFILAGIALWLVLLPWEKNLADGLLGGFLVGGGLLAVVLLYEKIRKVEAMGGGDLKLLFVTGLMLGWKRNLLCLLIACVLGIVWGLWMMKKSGEDAPVIPWGPSISAAAIVTLLVGEGVIAWYLRFF